MLTLKHVRLAEVRVATISHENNNSARAWEYEEKRTRVIFTTVQPVDAPAVWEASFVGTREVGHRVVHVSRLSAYAHDVCDKLDNDKEMCVCCEESSEGSNAGGGEWVKSRSNKTTGLVTQGILAGDPVGPVGPGGAAPRLTRTCERVGALAKQTKRTVARRQSRLQQHDDDQGDGHVRMDDEGRLEFRWNGVWGGVCTDVLGYKYTHADVPLPSPLARVVCRQLGLRGGQILPEQGSSSIYTLDITPRRHAICVGTEHKLSDCSSRDEGQIIHHQEIQNCADGMRSVMLQCDV